MTVAQTLPDAYDVFYKGPVEPGSSHYVEERRTYLRPELDDLVGIERTLDRALSRRGDRQPKLLVSGHKGTGKSTELLRATADVSDRCEILTCALATSINRDDVDARDILFVVLGFAVERLAQYEQLIRLDDDPDVKPALEMLGAQLLPHIAIDREFDIQVLGALKAKIRLDSKLRSALRRAAEARQDDLLELLNRCFRHLEEVVERPVVVFVDDLDKIPPDSPGGKQLYSIDFPLLLAPDVTLIYTPPMAVHYDPSFTSVHAAPDRFVLGHIKLWTDQERGARFAAGWDVMRRFVALRASPDLFETEVLDEAISLSGGSFEQLRRLLQAAIDHADYAGIPRVGRASLEHAVRKLRADFVRLWGTREDVVALRRIREQHTIRPSSDLGYLELLTVLEHPNEDPWFDVNPVFLPWLEREWAALDRAAGG